MKEPENHASTDCSLAQNSEDCFAAGVNPDDIIPFWNLSSRLPLLNAFITLFSGSDIYVVLRLLVLMEMVSKVDPPTWGMAELRHNFGYLSETAFETVTKRLRDGGLIDYRRDTNSYSVTSLGQKAQGAVSVFLKNEDDEGVGMLTSLIYAGEVTGTLGREELEHLLYRLNQLEYEIKLTAQYKGWNMQGNEIHVGSAICRRTRKYQWRTKGTAIFDIPLGLLNDCCSGAR